MLLLILTSSLLLSLPNEEPTLYDVADLAQVDATEFTEDFNSMMLATADITTWEQGRVLPFNFIRRCPAVERWDYG